MKNKTFYLILAMVLFLLMLLGVLPAMGQEKMIWDQDPRTETVGALLTLVEQFKTTTATNPPTITPMVKTATIYSDLENKSAAMTALANEQLTMTPTPLPLLVELEFSDGVAMDGYCRKLVDEVLSNFKVEDEKDFKALMNSFTHLQVRDGMVIDYLIIDDDYFGMAFIYSREEGQERFDSYDEFLIENNMYVPSSFVWEYVKNDENYINSLQLDGSVESYMDVMVFITMINQFYLNKIARENDWIFLCDISDVERIDHDFEKYWIVFEDDLRDAILSKNVTPVVEMDEELVKIRFVMFSKFKGLVEYYYVIDKINPLSIIDGGEQLLVEYDIGKLGD